MVGRGMPVLAKGDWLRCERGHGLARAVKDLYDGDPCRVEDFTEWMMATPSPGDDMECACGALIGCRRQAWHPPSERGVVQRAIDTTRAAQSQPDYDAIILAARKRRESEAQLAQLWDYPDKPHTCGQCGQLWHGISPCPTTGEIGVARAMSQALDFSVSAYKGAPLDGAKAKGR